MSAPLRCEACDCRFPRDTFAVIVEKAHMSGGRRMARVYQHTCGAYVVVLL